MEKFYKLSRPLYGKTDHLRLTCKLEKKIGAYCAYVEPVEYNPPIFGKAFCKEYYEIGGDGYYVLVGSSRKNTKREAQAIEMLEADPEQYIRKYLSHIDATKDIAFTAV